MEVYDVPCPRCGAWVTEPCWNLMRSGHPNKWPHAEREEALKKAVDARGQS